MKTKYCAQTGNLLKFLTEKMKHQKSRIMPEWQRTVLQSLIKSDCQFHRSGLRQIKVKHFTRDHIRNARVRHYWLFRSWGLCAGNLTAKQLKCEHQKNKIFRRHTNHRPCSNWVKQQQNYQVMARISTVHCCIFGMVHSFCRIHVLDWSYCRNVWISKLETWTFWNLYSYCPTFEILSSLFDPEWGHKASQCKR